MVQKALPKQRNRNAELREAIRVAEERKRKLEMYYVGDEQTKEWIAKLEKFIKESEKVLDNMG